MRVLILGGEGYLGWPTGIKLSNDGCQVLLVDNGVRREISKRENLPPLMELPDLSERVDHWNTVSGHNMEAEVGDVTDYRFLLEVFQKFKPDAVIHYAEQPSAPYSMASYEAAHYTLTNNLVGTLNVAYVVKETNLDIHIVKLGTMGEYGTPNIDIEEGYIEIVHKGRSDRFLYPRQASSLYHTTKIQDTDLLYFYVRNWGLRVTDLMQGPVYGLFSEEMKADPELGTIFSYDHIFGTVLNRFIVQASIGEPIIVYGSGTQKRGFLNLVDTLNCVSLAIKNPARRGELNILNQFTEVFSITEIAEKVKKASEKIGLATKIDHIANPRGEAENHYYNPTNEKFRTLGLAASPLTEDVLVEMLQFVVRNAANIHSDALTPTVSWR